MDITPITENTATENISQTESGHTVNPTNSGTDTPIIEIIDSTGTTTPESTTIAPAIETTATGDMNIPIAPIEAIPVTPTDGDILSTTTGTGL